MAWEIGMSVSSKRRPGRKGRIVKLFSRKWNGWYNARQQLIGRGLWEDVKRAYPEPSREPTHARVEWITAPAFRGGYMRQTATVSLGQLIARQAR